MNHSQHKGDQERDPGEVSVPGSVTTRHASGCSERCVASYDAPPIDLNADVTNFPGVRDNVSTSGRECHKKWRKMES